MANRHLAWVRSRQANKLGCIALCVRRDVPHNSCNACHSKVPQTITGGEGGATVVITSSEKGEMGKATHVSRITDGQARKEARDTLKLGRRRTGRRFGVLGDPAHPRGTATALTIPAQPLPSRPLKTQGSYNTAPGTKPGCHHETRISPQTHASGTFRRQEDRVAAK